MLWLVTRPEHKVRSPPSADVICRRHGSLMFRQLLAPLLAIASLGGCEAQAVHSDHFYVSNAADYVARHDYRVQVLERKPDGSPTSSITKQYLTGTAKDLSLKTLTAAS